MSDKRRKFSPIVVFFIISILTHVSIFLSILLSKEPARLTPPEIVEVNYIEPPPPTPKAPPPVVHQIVEQKERLNDEKDKDAKYLSQFDQKVIKETRTENSGKFNNTVAGGASPSRQKNAKDEKKQTKSAEEKGELPTLRDLSPQFSPTQGDTAKPAETAGEAPATDDYLKDVQKGIQTILSTREFVYYSYYARIKAQISKYWEPNVRERVKIIYRTGRSIASAHDRVTQLLIVLNSEGELIRVEVLGQSGVQDLDNAAVEAFRSAAPFPNPPKGMIEKDGTVKIRWDFILES
jgi:TonB family protein